MISANFNKWGRLVMLPIVLFSFVSCGDQKESDINSFLIKVERLGDKSPRDALLLLDNARKDYSNISQEELMAFRLLRVRLQDKANMIPESDKEMREICDYYEKHGGERERVRAYYYMGSVERDLHDSPKAVTYFLKSATTAEKSSEVDSMMLANTYSQLAALWRRQLQYEKSTEAAEMSYKIAEQAGILDPIYAMDVVTSSNLLGDTLRVLTGADKVLSMMGDVDSIYQYADVLTELTYIYAKYGRVKEAKRCHDMFSKISGTLPHNYWLVQGTYYEIVGKRDSAIVCFLQDMERPRISEREEAAQALFNIFNKDGRYREACNYALQWSVAKDSTEAEFRRLQASNAANEFIYHRDMEAENEILRESERNKERLFLTLTLSLIVLLGARVIYIRSKQRMARRVKNLSDERSRLEKQIVLYKKEIQDYHEDISKLEGETAERAKRMKELEQELTETQKLLDSKRADLRRLYVESITSSETDKISSLFKKIDKSAQRDYTMKREDWLLFYSHVDNMFPTFTETLEKKKRSISGNKKKVTYLMKIGKTIHEIMNITGLSYVTVWRQMKDMEKIVNEL